MRSEFDDFITNCVACLLFKILPKPTCRHDDQFKKLLIESIPGIEPVLKVLLQEDGNALESASKSLGKATQKVSDFGSSVADLGGKVSGAASTVTGFFTGAPAPDAPAATLKSK